ncbi:class I SAM-dependent DNA methyltransferase [Merismopedia glauca]|uniref:site-specific DNA-methyltransferase (adenine-specific) n=1 Tax=Merismopedia glauca CCAP 1448/3 TaxID=1296344 RepID=A0A2T1C479_9CYAN|nr:TaqI-like C-terminal specificity domain-containing protein [Merismopedia glauca]PSB03051.1 type II restriction endonuclease [Merismopedia glauca CCAP 1448/3]
MPYKLQPRQALNKAFLKLKPNRNEIELFKNNLIKLLDRINEAESEEFHKNLVSDFLKNTYYSQNHFINTKGRNDLVIHNGIDAQSSVGVILEAEKLTNKSEMLKINTLNTKAFQELVLYFLRERITGKNLDIRYLVATNIYEWFMFDASIFEKAFAQDKTLVKQFTDFEAGRLTGKTTEFFYQEIAKPAIASIESELYFTHFDIRDYEDSLRNPDKQDDTKLIALFKLLSPEHLLKLPFANDSNSLDKTFYTELLHIIGLTETKEGGKKLIGRKKESERNAGSLIENAIAQLDSLDKISRLEKPEQFGDTETDRLFNVALELAIAWVNRILFLKLLEAQLIKYHKGDKSFAFLNLEKVENYDDLNRLFFSVLARQHNERKEDVKKLFANVPYLNSSLFEPTYLEQLTIFISNLRDEKLPIFSSSVLKDSNGKKRTGELNALEYFFEFLNAYDFSSEGSEEIQEDNKRLINASVLGLIFEKINGYKDGSFFTPGFITMYMCRETIRRAIVQKFNEIKSWNCQDINGLYDKIGDKKEANEIINSLKICDPAVGSGHFLVSALNEVIAVKSELKILLDRQGKTLRDYHVEVVNDELIVTDDDGKLFEYNPKNKESQRIQETLFHEKQTLIENCLFGVDINPNSVKICRLRLWIELLKNAYYKPDSNYTELETLPNIDINIKCGNSLISRFALDADLRQALKKNQCDINTYKNAVQTYRNAENKQQKREMERLIDDIKKSFQTIIANNDIRLRRRNDIEAKLQSKQLGLDLEITQLSKTEQKAEEQKRKKLTIELAKIKAELEEINTGKIYQNALEWRFEFPEVLNDRGDFIGFDVIIGNPPYVRQEEIKAFKPVLQQKYQSYTGVADLFVYFYEQGLQLLKPKGYLTYISSNKYFRAGYGEKLRQLLTSSTTIHELIDFGDFPVFEEATAYPSIITLSKVKPDGNYVKALSWDEAKKQNIEQFATVLKQDSLIIPQEDLKAEGWRLESSQILDLLAKLRHVGTPLGEYVNGRFYRGILTGFNEAFVVNRATRDKLIDEHPSSAEVLKPFLRGRDVKRWQVNFADWYLIKLESSENKQHSWSNLPAKEAEEIFAETYPAIYKYFSQFREALIKRCDQGKFFWELRSCIYWQEFEQPKIIYPDIYEHQSFSVEKAGFYAGNTCYFIPINEQWLCGILNSQLIEWFYSMTSNSIRGGYVRAFTDYMKQIPIPTATESDCKAIETLVQKCLDAKGNSTPLVTDKGVKDIEQEIDKLVYQLYRLTEEEIKIVEGIRE